MRQTRAGHTDPASAHGGARNRRSRVWRHPLKRTIEAPYRVAAAIAVMAMGISEYRVIAEAVGLTVEEVRDVDSAEDLLVKELAVAGIPSGEFFRLRQLVRCPRCRAKVNVAPCIRCRNAVQLLMERT